MSIERAITRLREQMEDQASEDSDDTQITVRCGDVRAVIEAFEDALSTSHTQPKRR